MGSAIATCVKTLLTLYYNVKQKYIAWCVNHKCIIMTDQFDPLNPREQPFGFRDMLLCISLFLTCLFIFSNHCSWAEPHWHWGWKAVKISLRQRPFSISPFFTATYIFKVLGIYLWNKPACAILFFFFFIYYFQLSDVLNLSLMSIVLEIRV